MAEAEHSGKTTPQSPHRRHQQNYRPPYSNRGRGRLDPHVSKALHVFGVSDLRELLDRKHQDPRQSTNGPPPDPSYSYLKDPLRENTDCDNPSRVSYKESSQRVPSGSRSRGHSTRGSRGRGGYVNRDDKHNQFEASLIQNPINIKIALTTSTGERSCKLDEKNKLVDIKNISTRRPQERRSFRGERGGGRGSSERGRDRYDGGKERDDGHTSRDPRGRGGRRMGRGRERGGFNSRTSNRNNRQQNLGSNLDQKVNTTEVAPEDNWDTECSNPALESSESLKKKEGNSADLEVCTQNSEEHEPEEYYREDDVPPEVIEKNPLQRETEEDLVITSTVSEENEDGGKRTVTFKLVDTKDCAHQLEQAADLKDIPSEQKVNLADDEKGPDIQVNKEKNITFKSAVASKHDVGAKEIEIEQKEIKLDEKVKPTEVPKVELENESTNT